MCDQRHENCTAVLTGVQVERMKRQPIYLQSFRQGPVRGHDGMRIYMLSHVFELWAVNFIVAVVLHLGYQRDKNKFHPCNVCFISTLYW